MNKKFQLLSCIVTVAGLLLSACGAQLSAPTQTATLAPTSTSTSTVTPTPTFTPTPTPTPTPTATPIPPQPISLSNVSRITQIYQLGYGTVRAASWSPDGQLLALASSLGIYVYDMQAFWKDKTTLVLKQFIEAPDLTAIAFSPKGDALATGTKDGSVQVWRVNDFSLLYSFEGAHKNELGKNVVTVLKFSPLGDILVSGGKDGNVNVWKMIDGKLDKTIPAFTSKHFFVPGVEEIEFSSDGSLIYVGGSGGSDSEDGVKIFDLARGKQKKYRKMRNSRAFAFSPLKGLSAVSFYDDGVLLYDLITLEKIVGRIIQKGDPIFPPFPPEMYMLAFSPDGSILASGEHDSFKDEEKVTLWDTSTRQSIVTLPVQNSAIGLLSFSPDGTVLLTGGNSGLNFWHTKDGTPLTSLDQYAAIRGTSFSESGKIISISQSGMLSIWDALSNAILKQSEVGGRIIDVAFLNRERKVAVTTSLGVQLFAYNDDEISNLWKLDTGDAGTAAIVDVGGNTYLAYSLNLNMKIKVIDVGSQKEIATFSHKVPVVESMAISPDGKIIAVAGFDFNSLSARTEVWDAQAGKKLKVLGCKGVRIWKAQFSPDGTLLAETCDDKVIVQRPLKGDIVWSAALEKWGEMTSIAFSQDGKILASGDSHGTIVLWDVETGEKLITLNAHLDKVNSLVFSEDGTMLVSGSEDGTIKVWGIP